MYPRHRRRHNPSEFIKEVRRENDELFEVLWTMKAALRAWLHWRGYKDAVVTIPFEMNRNVETDLPNQIFTIASEQMAAYDVPPDGLQTLLGTWGLYAESDVVSGLFPVYEDPSYDRQYYKGIRADHRRHVR